MVLFHNSAAVCVKPVLKNYPSLDMNFLTSF